MRAVPSGGTLRLFTAVVVVVLLAGCTSSADHATPPSNSGGPQPVGPNRSAHIDLQNVTVEIPAGAAAAEGTLTARLADAALPEGLDVAGPAIEAHLSDTTLVQPATVTWKLDPPADLEGAIFAPFVVSVADNGDVEAVNSSWDQATNTLTAHPTHFSIQVPGWLNPKRALAILLDGITSYVTGRANAPAPTCDNEDKARAGGIEARSSDGDLVKWCFGMDGSTRIVKLVNNRSAPVMVTFANQLHPRDVAGSGISAESVGRWISSQAPPSTPNSDIRVLGGGQTLVLEVPDGLPANAQLGADVEMDLFSWAFAGFDLAWDAVSKASIGSAADALKKAGLEREAFVGSSKLLDCLRSQLSADLDPRGVVGASPTSSDDAVKAAKIGLECGLDVIPAIADAQGSKIGKIIDISVATIVGLVHDGAGMIAAALRDAVDIATGDSTYQFRLISRRPPGDTPVLSSAGLGALQFGMSPEQAQATGLVTWDSYDFTVERDGYLCGGASPAPPWPPKAFFTVVTEEGLVLIAVLTESIRTTAGVGVGSTRAKVEAAFGPPTEVSERAYEPGTTLYFRDGSHGIAFNLDDSDTVANMQAGTWDGVHLIEGCL